MEPNELEARLSKLEKVPGWFHVNAARVFALVDEVQRDLSIEGDIFEVGVHFGRSASFLAAMLRDHETLGVCDLFGAQEANVSQSGGGNREIFEQNVSRVVSLSRVRVFAGLSRDLTSDDVGPCRFFHVDGGHTREEALSDLQLGAASLVPGGVVAIDDAFTPEWPGVTEALFEFISDDAPLSPLVLGFNKLLLVAPDYREAYERRLAEPWDVIKDSRVALKREVIRGWDVLVFYVPTWKASPRRRMRHRFARVASVGRR